MWFCAWRSSSRRHHDRSCLLPGPRKIARIAHRQGGPPSGACRGTQRRSRRRPAVSLGTSRGLEKLPLRAESKISGGFDCVPPPCWEDHLSERKNRNKQMRRNPAASTATPPQHQSHRLVHTPHGGRPGSMPGSQTRHLAGGIGGRRTRSRKFESQRRSRFAEIPFQRHPGG